MSAYQLHPAAELFPLMSESEFAGLKQDIAENGQREDIVSWNGKIIDGRNRLRACEELGRQPSIAELDDDQDPWKYVISHNLHRRHLTDSQRAMVAAKLATLKQGGDKSKTPIGTSLDDAAEQLKVSKRTVNRAKTVITKGTSELADMVRDGQVSVSAAEAVSKKTATEQKAIVEAGPKAVKEAAKTVPKRVARGSDGRSEYANVASTNLQFATMAILQLERIDFSQECWSDALTKVKKWIDEKRKTKQRSFLRIFQELWNEADDTGKAAIRVWLSEQTITPELGKPKARQSKAWRADPVEVVVEASS